MLCRQFLKRTICFSIELHENKIRFRAIGRLHDLPKPVQKELERVSEATKSYTDSTLILALSYGGRAELVDAMRKMGEEIKAGELDPEDIDQDTVARHLYAPDVPDPDLLIRTSGEMRVSNFLLWQISYAELYVTDIHWPDFKEEHFMKALESYKSRHRRFGDIK